MTFEQLISIDSIAQFTQERQINTIGLLFDLSFDNGSIKGIEHGFRLAEQVKTDELAEENFTLLQYDLSNGWSYLRTIKYHESNESWQFQMEELVNEVFHLRKAIASKGFSKVAKIRQCQIYTNLGNTMSFIGRFVEAQEYWTKAIKVDADFSMAIGNMANGLSFYGRMLYDDVHANLFQIYAYHYLAKALTYPQQLHNDAAEGFRNLHDGLYNYISKNFPSSYLNDFPELNDFDLGEDQELKNYRIWCLNQKLYLNPLNDLGAYNTASHDCLNLPTLTVSATRPPAALNLYNQIKQEFGTARYAYYTSQSNGRPHFSDVDVKLVETMETIRYSYYIEQLKISFRMAYSILDKVAYLLNDYLQLAIDPGKVSCRSVWYVNPTKKELRPFFKHCNNWALRGLYWLSKDLFEKNRDFDIVLEPEAKEVALIRNYIEHKGFKVLPDVSFYEGIFHESDISYNIRRSDFENKTIKLLRLTRAAIIYVAIAVSHEEKKRDYANSRALHITPTVIPFYART